MNHVIAGQTVLFDGSKFTVDEQRWPCTVCGGMPVPDEYVDYVDPRMRKYWGGTRPGMAPQGRGSMLRSDGRFWTLPYVMLCDRSLFYGDEAKRIMRDLGGNPPA